LNREDFRALISQYAAEPLPAWEEHYLEIHSARYLDTLALLGPGQGRRLLDVGAFPGHLTLGAHYLGYEVYGLTGKAESTTSLDMIGRRLTRHRITLDLADVESEPFPFPDGFFDRVLASEIIEHLHFNPFRLLRESFRVLKPGGHFLLSTPNLARLENLWHLFKEQSIHSDLRRRFDEVFSAILSTRHVREYTAFDLSYLLEGQNKEMYGFEKTKIHYSACSDPPFSWPRLARLLERIWPRFHSTLLVEAVRPDRTTLVRPQEVEALQGFYPVEEQEADMKGIARMLTTPFRWTGKTAEVSLPASQAPYQVYYINLVLLVPESLPPALWMITLDEKPLTCFCLTPDRMFTQLRLVLPPGSARRGRFLIRFSGPSWRPLDYLPASDFEFSLQDPRELGLVVGWDGFLRRDCESFKELLDVARWETLRLERYENFNRGVHWRRLHHGYDDRWSHMQILYLLQADFKPVLPMGKEDWRQLGPGWYFLENWSEGPIRWTGRRAEAYLFARPGSRQLYLRVFSGDFFLGERITGSLKLAFSSDRFSFLPLVESSFTLSAGIWTDLTVPFPESIRGPGLIRLILQVDQSRVPAGLIPGSSDTRELGLAVAGLAVT
jgi:SAM-dependent methyltransferase